MIRTILTIAAAACCAMSLILPAAAAEKPKAAADEPKQCDVYGPGFEPLGTGSNVCIKIGVSVEFVVQASSGGHGSVADTSDWIRTKPARAGN